MAVELQKHTVNLSKGEKVNLSKSTDYGLTQVMIGLGWQDMASQVAYQETTMVQPGFFGRLFGAQPRMVTRTIRPNVQDIDCDAWVALLENGNCRSVENDVVFYGNLQYFYNRRLVIMHHGDDLVGGGGGDNEEIDIDLSLIPPNYDGILIGVTIYKAVERGQSFDSISDMFIRIVDKRDGFEICRYNQKQIANSDENSNYMNQQYQNQNMYQNQGYNQQYQGFGGPQMNQQNRYTGNGLTTFLVGVIIRDRRTNEWQFEAQGRGLRGGQSIREVAYNYQY